MTELSPDAPATSCAAPSTSLYFHPSGEVAACCRREPFGRIGRDRLRDIWDGVARHEVVEHLAAGRFEGSCGGCGEEITLEGRPSSYPATFDRLLNAGGASGAADWPSRIEFNLSDVCNLQCIQCNGSLSSSIRIHREGRRPLESPYDDEFFEDLREFIPHLRSAQFAGGEPFLAPESFRLWDMIAELNPDLSCTVVTNATRWNDRIEAVVGRLRMGFVFSLDGVTKEVYEAVRIGADFDEVMENVERFRAVAADASTETSINFCLLPENYRDFGNVLSFADERGMRVKVQVVRDSPVGFPMRVSDGVVEEAAVHLRGETDRVLPSLSLNADVWTAEVERLSAWAATPPDRLRELVRRWGWPTAMPTVLGLPFVGTEASGVESTESELRSASPTGRLHTFGVDTRNVVTDVSESLCDLLGRAEEELVGRSAELLEPMTVEALGEVRSSEIVRSDDNRRDVVVDFGDIRSRTSLVAIRGDDGRCLGGRAFILVEGRG